MRQKTLIFATLLLMPFLIIWGKAALAQEEEIDDVNIPEGLVAITLPIDKAALVYGMESGSYVDVIMSFPLISVDNEFQSRLPNTISSISRNESGVLEFGPVIAGRVEASTISSLGAITGPSEPQRARLATQRTVQNLLVLHIEIPPDPPANSNPNQPVEIPPARITFAVTEQDSLILTWAVRSQVFLNLTLRNQEDVIDEEVIPVTLQYLNDNFGLTPPPTLPYNLDTIPE